MDEIPQVLHSLDPEKLLDVLDDRVELMEQKLHGRMGKILFDIAMLLVFEHTLSDRVYANLFHLSYFLLYLILMLMLKKKLYFFLQENIQFEITSFIKISYT
jgi:hypothetical protein